MFTVKLSWPCGSVRLTFAFGEDRQLASRLRPLCYPSYQLLAVQMPCCTGQPPQPSSGALRSTKLLQFATSAASLPAMGHI
jgi:hypothetical protein